MSIYKFIINLFFVGFLICNLALAQTNPVPPTEVAPVKPALSASPATVGQIQIAPKEAKAEPKKATCPCLEPGVEPIQKAYLSLEEDEWPAAIKVCTDTQKAINDLAKTCKCPEVAVYQNIAKGYLNYAKGGNILDGDDSPDCKVALKLYDEAIKLLSDSIPKITNLPVKTNTQNIRDYCKEELDFVKDECQKSP